jgi:hypothetical protein
MTKKFDKLVSKILVEMSTKAKPIKVNALEFQTKWNNMKERLEILDNININGNDIGVQMMNIGSYIEFYFIQDDSLVISYIELEVLDDGGVTIMYVWNSGHSGSIMYKLYTQFLLDNFEYIKSDSIHTPKGFMLWKSFTDDPVLNVHVIDELDEKIPEILVKNGNELEKYFGDTSKMRYVYKLTKNT